MAVREVFVVGVDGQPKGVVEFPIPSGSVGDFYGLFADLPAPGNVGRQAITSDGVVLWVDDGDAWRPYFGGTVGKRVPLVADWDSAFGLVAPSDNRGTVVLATAGTGTPDVSGLAFNGEAPYLATAHFAGSVAGADFNGSFGIVQRNSESSKAVLFGVEGDGAEAMRVVVASYDGGVRTSLATAPLPAGGVGVWCRIGPSGETGISYQVSPDGQNWSEVFAGDLPFTADQIGIACASDTNESSFFDSWDHSFLT